MISLKGREEKKSLLASSLMASCQVGLVSPVYFSSARREFFFFFACDLICKADIVSKS